MGMKIFTKNLIIHLGIISDIRYPTLPFLVDISDKKNNYIKIKKNNYKSTAWLTLRQGRRWRVERRPIKCVRISD